jgi:hypothetical protein
MIVNNHSGNATERAVLTVNGPTYVSRDSGGQDGPSA